MSKEQSSDKWTTWADVRKEVFTPEEIAESDQRVALMSETGQDFNEITKKAIEDTEREIGIVGPFNSVSELMEALNSDDGESADDL